MRLHWDVGGRRRAVSLGPPSSLLSSAGKLPEKPRKPDGEGRAGETVQTPGPAENQGPAANFPLPDRAQNTGSNPVGATKLFLLSVSGPGSRNIPMFLEPIGARPTAW